YNISSSLGVGTINAGRDLRVLKKDKDLSVDRARKQPRTANLPFRLCTSVIVHGHKLSSNKSFAMYKKTSPRSDLMWKPTGRIFKSVGFRWLPTGKLFDSCTSKVEREPTNGFNANISNIHECKQTLDLSAGKSQSLVTAKADISEINAKVDSQMMKSVNGVSPQQF
nr:hypothetical protein [Tanacetum cinerariifolium]